MFPDWESMWVSVCIHCRHLGTSSSVNYLRLCPSGQWSFLFGVRLHRLIVMPLRVKVKPILQTVGPPVPMMSLQFMVNNKTSESHKSWWVFVFISSCHKLVARSLGLDVRMALPHAHNLATAPSAVPKDPLAKEPAGEQARLIGEHALGCSTWNTLKITFFLNFNLKFLLRKQES